MKYTRKDYLAKVCTHREYYAQFATEEVKRIVRGCIGLDRLRRSTDEHLNDIPLREWDILRNSIYYTIGRKLVAANGAGGVTLSDIVCVAKEAAKQMIEE